jgi:hypothetical protein
MARTVAPSGSLDPATWRLILLLPVAFLAHDLGELAGNEELNQAVTDLARRFPILAERVLPHFTTSRAQAALAIGLLAGRVTLLSWRAARSAPRSSTMTAYAAVVLLGVHMLRHTMQAIMLRRVLPGLAGGLLVSLPYSMVVNPPAPPARRGRTGRPGERHRGGRCPAGPGHPGPTSLQPSGGVAAGADAGAQRPLNLPLTSR